MKKIIATTMAAGLVVSSSFAAVSTTLDLASAYVFRGATLNDGAVFQPGIEASGFEIPEEYGAVALGAWANYDINDYGAAPGSTFTETDWYISYSLPPLVEGLDLFVGYTEYMYGGAARDEELNIGAGYEIAGVALGLTYYQGVGGLIGTSSYIEGAASYALDISEALSASVDATIGFADQDGGENGFQDYSIGATIGGPLTESWSWGLTGTYIGQGDDKVLPDGVGAYDVDFVGMLSLACDM
jgi:uncharacterized protein (TIGR02001 family)